jgi:hypothetical protein
MNSPEDLQALADKLTDWQRTAILTAPSTPHGNVWLTCGGTTKAALVKKLLATGYGDWCTLTDLGKEVRELLRSRKEQSR